MRLILSHVFALLAGVAIGVAFVVAVSPRGPIATVKVLNQTDEVIPTVRIYNAETGGTLTIDNLAPQSAETLHLFVRGEGSYRVTADFADNTTLEGEPYFESGYSITKRVLRDNIEPDFGLY